MLLPALQGDDAMGEEGISSTESENLLLTAASFATKPAGRAMIVLSLSSPSLSLFSAKVHSSCSDMVFKGRPRPSRGGALYVVDGR